MRAMRCDGVHEAKNKNDNTLKTNIFFISAV
jgi:hypothetical protein